MVFFLTKVGHCLSRKREQFTSIRRAIACTEAMAREHLDEFAREAISLGIFKDAIKRKDGV